MLSTTSKIETMKRNNSIPKATFFSIRSHNLPLLLLMVALMFVVLVAITYLSLPGHSTVDLFPKSISILTNEKIGEQNITSLNNNKVTSSQKLAKVYGDGILTHQQILKTIKDNLNNVQNDPEDIVNKRNSIKKTFIKAYEDYERHCNGQDELIPLGSKCHNWVGLGLTIIDAIDTMYIMGEMGMFDRAKSWISKSLDFNIGRSVSFFETVIRCLGGLMSIYDLSEDEIFFTKAKDLAERLYGAFKDNNLPLSEVNLQNGQARAAGWTGGSVLLAEIGTIQLEFTSVSDRGGDKKYGEKTLKIFDDLDPDNPNGVKLSLPIRGQYPIFLDPYSKTLRNSHVTWGAMGDSFYEYLLKTWIYTGKTVDRYRKMYIEAVEGMIEHLYQCNEASKLCYIAEWKGGHLDHKMDELACFVGGTMALGVYHNATTSNEQAEKHLKVGKKLAETCYEMYHQQFSGLSPEYIRFTQSGMSNGIDFYILRPETVETFFYLWRVTKEQKWRDFGWEIYLAIEKFCRVTNGQGTGYAPILNVGSNPRQDPQGVQHSFFLAETLKYLYLLFSDDNLISIDQFVFNTEAHPIIVQGKKNKNK